MNKNGVKFIFPIDGDCLNKYDGEETNSELKIKVIIEAEKYSDIYINSKKALYDGKYFYSYTILKNQKSIICVKNGENNSFITVYYFRKSTGKYRITVDDNILFLQNITNNRDVYKSIFDDPFLSIFKKAHDKFNACLHFNLFYEVDNYKCFKNKRDYFNLSMMTDKFKTEWEENSNWLKLSFHSYQEFPDMPYKNKNSSVVYEDAKKVNDEIIRFAGEKSLSSVCTIHWGEVENNALIGLKNIGYKGYAGFFEFDEENNPVVSYNLPINIIKHLNDRDFWIDTNNQIFFNKTDMVLNTIKYQDLNTKLDEILKDKHKSGFLDFLIHEQYFYIDYEKYIKEYEEIVLDTAKKMYDNNYVGALIEDVVSL